MRELTIALSIVAIGGVLGFTLNSLLVGLAFILVVGGIMVLTGVLANG